jgi:uncharacterized protein YutE (UPF0331/DUF86 family)
LVDRNLILRKLAELEEYSNQLAEYSHITVEEYARDWKTQRIVERTLQMMIELCADMTNHIISDRGLRVPVTYADTFKVLNEAGLIDDNLEAVFIKMAKFRNIIVHDYDKIDHTIVVMVLQKHLGDFIAFRDQMLKFV